MPPRACKAPTTSTCYFRFRCPSSPFSSKWTGSIPVTTGQQLDLDIRYGMLLFVGNGEFESRGSFTAHRTVPQPTSADNGLIEYRFVPEWWIKDVDRLTGLLDDHA